MAVESNLNPKQRATKIAALIASGMSQRDIAKTLNISRSTVQRDIEDIKPGIAEAKDLISEYNEHFDRLYPLEQSAEDYVDLARNAKNEAVRLGAQQRVDDLRGIVTEKERIRAKQSEQPANQPLFVFQSGAQISFGPTTIGGDAKSLHNTSTVQPLPYIDVEPESHKGGTVNKDE